jgi:hypothetical protein
MSSTLEICVANASKPFKKRANNHSIKADCLIGLLCYDSISCDIFGCGTVNSTRTCRIHVPIAGWR